MKNSNVKKFCTLIFTFVFVISLASAQRENTESEYHDTSVGFNFQLTMGTSIAGITYQHWFKNNWGIQGTVGATVTDSVFYSADLQLQRLFFVHDLNKKSLSSLFGWVNMGVASTDISEDYSKEIIKPAINVGAGIGIEFIFWEHLSIPIKFGFVGQFLNNPAFGLSAGAGILYRF